MREKSKNKMGFRKGGNGMNNSYPVKGVLHMLSAGSSTIEQTEEIINMYIELSTRKGYAEGVTDTLRRNEKSLYKSEKARSEDLNEEERQSRQEETKEALESSHKQRVQDTMTLEGIHKWVCE